MIKLNDEQQKALKSHPGQPLRLVNPATDQAFVLLRVEDFERLNRCSYDASPWTDEEMDLWALEDADGLGWDGLDAFQDQTR